jgi:CheY-like chemotaxis protein
LIQLAPLTGTEAKELASSIKAEQSLRGVRLVFAKPYGRSEKPSSLARAGFDAWIAEPIVPDKLQAAFQHVAEASSDDAPFVIARSIAQEAVEARRPDKEGLRVLLVEDNLVNQSVADLLLKQCGCATTLSGNGIEAVDAVSRGHFDLVLMDCQMPIMDGFEAARAIRSTSNEDKAAVPIIAMASNPTPRDRELARAAGMNDLLSKPLSRAELAHALVLWGGSATRSVATPARGTRTMQTSHDRPVLDPEVIASLRELGGEDDPQLFQELVRIFLDDTPQRLRELLKAFEQRDPLALERAAHALKSSAANLGALHLSTLFKEIEMAGRTKDVTKAEAFVRQSESEFALVEDALRRECAK